MTSFQAWDDKKILSLDLTSDDIVCVGGEVGVDIWRIGKESDCASFVHRLPKKDYKLLSLFAKDNGINNCLYHVYRSRNLRR
jgi:hypothetical protein